MTKTDRRRDSGIYLSKAKRNNLRNMLRAFYGDNCCWCGEPMLFPEPGEHLELIEQMATIEHHFAKEADKQDSTFLLRLSHKKCNK